MRKLHWVAKGCAAALISAALLFTSSIASAASIHTAQNKDTFWKLSKQYSVPLDELMQANAKINPLNIYPGLKITIPDKSKPMVKAKAKAKAVSTAGVKTVAVNGKSVDYKKVIQAKASAYTAAAEENGGWAGLDYFGNALKVGTVAVDPETIPLGTKLYIAGYDYDGLPKGGMLATATDVGGSIKGNRVDIFVPDNRKKAMTFGFQYVKVYVLD
ncbi:LysM peptidoglycan-binding domain-containing protein [Paenibacillaceae bacterium]|nr:LysM peptidoglycan-binding domain-containing protein [Paenibacillaceae bacterium]